MEITKGENANLAGMEPRCPKCGNGLCVVVDTDPNDYQAYAVAITCQHGACQYKVFPGWDAKDFLPFFRSPAPTPPLDVPSVEEIIKLLGNGWKGFKLGDMDDLMFVVGQIRLAIQKFYSLRRHIASPAPQLKVDEPCPTCERRYLGNMGPGEYSCVSCGMGLNEPCEHWKKMLAENEQLDKLATSPAQPEKRDEVKACEVCDETEMLTVMGRNQYACPKHRAVAPQSGKEGQ